MSGYRRRKANELANNKEIPAFVYEMSTQEAIAYRKAVKDNPDAPIPGKLLNPTAEQDKDKGKEAAVPAAEEKEPEKSAEAVQPDAAANSEKDKDDHKPTVAEITAKAEAGEVVNISDLIDAQQREREAKKDAPAPERGNGKGKGQQKAGRRKKGYSSAELQSDEKLAIEMGISTAKLNRIVRFSEAVKGVCDLVDDNKLTISVAAEISYLKPKNQEALLHLMQLDYKPTNVQIQRMKKAEAGGKLDDMTMDNDYGNQERDHQRNGAYPSRRDQL